MADREGTHVVTAFLRNDGAVLLCRRSEAVGSYRGLWGGVSGYAEGDPDAAVRREIAEETGLDDAVAPVRAGEPFAFADEAAGERWVVHPYLFDCDRRDATTNRETAETDWVQATEMLRRETVPRLWTSYARVAPTVETVATDDAHGSTYVSLRALEVLRDRAGALDAGQDRPGDGDADLAALARRLHEARPAMAAVANRVDRAMRDAGDLTPAAVEAAAMVGVERSVAADGLAAERAAELVAGDAVLTLSRSGTVYPALSSAPARVVVAESRPAMEGVGVAERLAADGQDVTLVTDAATAKLLGDGEVDAVLVGADAVLADGSVVNKTGTRGVAVAAAREDVPVFAAAAADKVRGDREAHLESGPAAAVYDGDADLAVANPTFDVTPPECVAGVVTEQGVLDAGEVAAVAADHRALADWDEDG